MVDGLIGVDVSSNNSSNWEDDDWDYGWVKATEGKSYVNPDAAHQLGVIRGRDKQAGHYHWLNDGDVDAQVQWFIDQADVQPGDLIACDWEDSSNPSCAQKDDWIKQVQDHYGTANKVGLYCNRDWWFNRDTTSFAGDYLWIANPNGGSDPGIEYDWTFHQYTWEPYDKNRAPKFKTLADLQAWAGSEGPPEPPDPVADGVWFSTDYLFPQVKPNPTNPNGVKKGNEVKVTASGGLTARVLPGGPKSVDKDGKTIVRESGYTFDVTGDLVDGWVTGGTNWYSSDYLDVVDAPPPSTTPGWTGPVVILDDPSPDPNRYVSYAQAVVRVGPVTTDDGTQHPECYVLAQDYENKGDIRFYLARADGHYADQWFQVNDAGHGQTFHAYRSAAGNLYVWCGENAAYRHKWQSGAKVSKTSGTKMDYKGCRPVGSHEPWVGFRDATDTKETFYLFDRTDFTDGTNRTNPKKSVTVNKRTDITQQSWAVTEHRIYRITGSTNDDPPNGKGLHQLDVLDWSGRLLLSKFDITKMAISTTSDEPEGLTFTGTPGSVLAGKREGSTDPAKRSYPLWKMTNLP
jgi:hypothetical protein